MHCPKCQHENREGARFCESCGSKLELACPSCRNQVRPGAAFCDNCGTSLTGTKRKRRIGESGKRGKRGKAKQKGKRETPSDSGPRTPDSGLTSAERRQLTVMFCDLVDSTALSEQLDPEEWRAVVQEYQRVCAEGIHRFDGCIAQYLGDGLLVYFGYPVAHEDDAQRAARVGLEILAELPSLNERLRQTVRAIHELPLQVRIGIHTGLVVIGEIGEGGRREQLALGDTPNIAARLQGLAKPDTVVISAATHRLIAGLLDCQDLGSHSLKGVSTPIQIYKVVGESGARSRLDVAVTTGLTPLVGREEEVGLLFKRWEQAKAGDGQVVMLNGEAGIGKSRLVQVLKEHITHEVHAQVECRCSPYYQNSALYPVIDHLQRLLEFHREDSSEEKFDKLERALTQYSFNLAETAPFFASLLSLSAPRFPLPVLTTQRQKQKTLEALLVWLLKEAERQPILMVMEDLHWVDPSTQEFLSLLIDQVSTARLYIVLTFRPDFSPPWAMLSHMTQLTLSRLARRQVEAMVEKVTGGKTLPAEVVQQLVTKTDGIPLFVEELTKMVVESVESIESVGSDGRTSLQSLAIPATLHDSLMARLDRLPTAKEVAQLGASLGREFSYELIQAVSPVEEKTLQLALAKLVEAELLYQRGLPPQAHYVFKHALIQDAAYQSLLKSTRQQYHHQIARVLEERFPETRETQPELLAEAYGKVGQAEEGLTALAEALTVADKTGERFYEAELYRLKGELVLQSEVRSPESKPLNPHSAFRIPQLEAEAEECFQKAIEIARQQQAKSLGLRAVMSLSRLWQQQGKKVEARQMLAEIYGWFTEGFDTADLKEAKALLEALA